MIKYPFGYWYGRMKFLRNYAKWGWLWDALDKIYPKLPDYLAGMDTKFYGGWRWEQHKKKRGLK